MSEISLKLWSRGLYNKYAGRLKHEINEGDLARSAIVFSPHPDDETLGCGGTIIRKRRAGADIKVVYMTDGRHSHSRFIADRKLKVIRESEARAACRELGLESGNITFLGYEDGRLRKNIGSAIEKVEGILREYEPDDIFIPYCKEPPPDHSITNKIVTDAIRKLGKKVVIYEYPIWFWQHWPWMAGPKRKFFTVPRNILLSIISGIRLVVNFRCSIYIGDIIGVKRAALEEHKSQMTKLTEDPDWPILDEVGGGEFLQCFFQEYEIFYRHSVE
jgi:LmbE family N-acetylglucosaminyl deacetylase